MEYVLKNSKEADRLERQSKVDEFSVENELSELVLPTGCDVLEVGCGAGSLISYLNSKFSIKAKGCDLQEEHIEHCLNNYGDRIEFFQHDIIKSPLSEKFDYVFMRYIAHHLGQAGLMLALKNIKKSLRPGGKIFLIDIDGLFSNIGTVDKNLINYLEKFNSGFHGDFFIGRKIPNALKQAGFNNIKLNVKTIVFEGQAKVIELDQMKERLNFCKELIVKCLGSELEFKRFYKLYISEFEKSECPYFVNKFIVSAKN